MGIGEQHRTQRPGQKDLTGSGVVEEVDKLLPLTDTGAAVQTKERIPMKPAHGLPVQRNGCQCQLKEWPPTNSAHGLPA